MHNINAATAEALTQSDLSRVDQAVCLIASVYPVDADFDAVVDSLENWGPKQNRTRLRIALKASKFVSQGATKNSFRANPRFVGQVQEQLAAVTGAPKVIVVNDTAAVIPVGTLPTTRPYIASIVRQVNEGHASGHHDSAAVMLRRLTESLLIECYRHVGRVADLRLNGKIQMLDGLITTFAVDTTIGKSRNLIAQLRTIKELGDNAAHNRTYITNKADIEDVKADARRCLSEMGHLAGL